MGNWCLLQYACASKDFARLVRFSKCIYSQFDRNVLRFRVDTAKKVSGEANTSHANDWFINFFSRSPHRHPFGVCFAGNHGCSARTFRSCFQNVPFIRKNAWLSSTGPGPMRFSCCLSLPVVCDVYDKKPHREWHSQDERFYSVLSFVKAATVRQDRASLLVGHCLALKVGALAHLPVAVTLVTAYSQATDLDASRALFDEVLDKDVIAWNAMITALAHNQRFGGALDLFARMIEDRVGFDSTSLLIIASILTRAKQLNEGRALHGVSVKLGMLSNPSLCNALINLYAKCGDLSSSEHIFVRMNRDCISWNSILSGCLYNNNPMRCLQYFREQMFCGSIGDSVSLSCAISAATSFGEPSCGEVLHGMVIKMGYERNLCTSVANSLISFYFQHGESEDADAIFRGMMTHNDVISWNTIIDGFASIGNTWEAFNMLSQMLLTTAVKPDKVTLLILMSVCADKVLLREGRMLHGYIVRRCMGLDLALTNSLLDMYMRGTCVGKAEVLFNSITKRDLISWNTMISGYYENGLLREAQSLFKEMLLCSSECSLASLVAILPSCNSPEYLRLGESIHCLQVRLGYSHYNLAVNEVIYMYVTCGDVRAAFKLLYWYADHGDVTSWNTFISSCSKKEFFWEAVRAFGNMRKEADVTFDSITLVNALLACGNLELILQGRLIHGLSLKTSIGCDIRVQNALISMYGRCTDIASARSVFKSIRDCNLCSWNCMISALCQNKAAKEAVELFGVIELEYDEITIVSILSACTQLGIIRQGTQIHAQTFRLGFHKNSFVSAALLDMYSNCGRLDVADRVFRISPQKSLASWNSIISAYGYHGKGEKAIELFEEMCKTGTKATKSTFVSLLSACSHSRLVKEGLWYYKHMPDKYGIEPITEHHLCVVDMLGRSGKLYDAYEFIKQMKTPIEPGIWGALLSSCNYHGNIQMGREVAELLFKLEPENSGYYISLANMYVAAGGWKDAVDLREMMQVKGLRKPIGYSLVDVSLR